MKLVARLPGVNAEVAPETQSITALLSGERIWDAAGCPAHECTAMTGPFAIGTVAHGLIHLIGCAKAFGLADFAVTGSADPPEPSEYCG